MSSHKSHKCACSLTMKLFLLHVDSRVANISQYSARVVCCKTIQSSKASGSCHDHIEQFLCQFKHDHKSLLSSVAQLKTPDYYSARNKFERFRGFWNKLADSNSIFVVEDFFLNDFEFLVCSKFNHTHHTQCGRSCACAVACFVPTQFHFECCGVRGDS